MKEELRRKRIAAMSTKAIQRSIWFLSLFGETDDVPLMREELERRGVPPPSSQPEGISPRTWIIFLALVFVAWRLWLELR